MNTYGPTETSIVVSRQWCDAGERAVAIGVPTGGVTLMVLEIDGNQTHLEHSVSSASQDHSSRWDI